MKWLLYGMAVCWMGDPVPTVKCNIYEAGEPKAFATKTGCMLFGKLQAKEMTRAVEKTTVRSTKAVMRPICRKASR